jgi:hypothetical protein
MELTKTIRGLDQAKGSASMCSWVRTARSRVGRPSLSVQDRVLFGRGRAGGRIVSLGPGVSYN